MSTWCHIWGERDHNMRSLKIKYQTPKNQISHHKQNNIKIEQSMFALAPPPHINVAIVNKIAKN